MINLLFILKEFRRRDAGTTQEDFEKVGCGVLLPFPGGSSRGVPAIQSHMTTSAVNHSIGMVAYFVERISVNSLNLYHEPWTCGPSGNVK